MSSLGTPNRLLRRRLGNYLRSFSLFLLVLLGVVPSGQCRDLPEHQIKAAFLFNFAAFVTWPNSMFESPATPLRFCTQDAKKISDILAQLIVDETLNGRPIALVRLHSAADITDCHILFLGRDASYGALMQAGLDRGTLTVGDTQAFIEGGGMIALLRKRKRIHPVINMDVLEASSLRLSSKLLRLATLVRSGKED
jgi:hypothetical protein